MSFNIYNYYSQSTYIQANAKPRFGAIFELMRRSRARFKYCLRFCKSVEDRAIADSLAKQFMNKDTISFWKDIQKIGSDGLSLCSETVGNATGEADVTQMWFEHYKSLLNLQQSSSKKSSVLDFLEVIDDAKKIKFSVQEIVHAVKGLKCGKSPGLDHLQGEHFKYADDTLYCLLCMIFNSMLSHGHLPSNFMQTIIVPILKDKKGVITDKDNYRPIAITSVASKILELVLLKHLSDHLNTQCNQFGFKSKHSTDMCIFTLKQIIEFYVSKGSPVYVCYLDASKAFDRISHWSLFAKLIDRQVNPLFVRLLFFWYSQQTMCIRWSSCLSPFFTVSNGVRQGGIISPIFFNIYMDDLSVVLNSLPFGCNMNGVMMNHLMYADDACVLAPSPTALQKLLDACCEFAIDNAIVYNEKKSKCMCFKPSSMSDLYIPTVSLNGNPLVFVREHKYLGVFLTSDFCDDSDIFRQVKALYARGNLLVRRFKKCSEEVKTFLFKTYCSNNYCSHLWFNYRRESFKKCIVAYNDVYRSLFGIKRGESISQRYVFSNVDSLGTIIRKTVFAFTMRLQNSDNVIISTIVNGSFYKFYSSLTRKWLKVLYL